jgi:hypothetical protein
MASGDLSRPMNQKSRVHRRDSTVADMPAPLEFLENMTFRSGTNLVSVKDLWCKAKGYTN